MKKLITASLMMALGVAGAQAGGGYVDNTQYVAPATTVTAPADTANATAVLVDVPAGHWAREAVEYIADRGLIEGFPDGTFRGNEYLTRYQAALIFHRLLQSGAMSNADMSDEDMLVITRGMQQVSEELAAISNRLTDVERLTVEQQARLDALEDAIANLDTGDNSVLVARLDALEARIAEIENMPAPVQPAPVTPVTPVTTAPVKEVEVVSDTIELGNVDVVEPVVTTGIGQTYFGIGGSYYPTTKDAVLASNRCSNPFDAITSSFKNLGKKDAAENAQDIKNVDYCTSAFVTVGGNNLANVGGLGLGARANVEYYPESNNTVSGDINAVSNFDLGLLQPYVGAGVGVVNGQGTLVRDVNGKFTTDTKRENDIYGNVLLGTDFQLARNIGLFAEANGKYFFSNKTGVVQRQIKNEKAGETEKGFGYGFRGGLKFFF